jgi:hypothetical protein
MFHVEQIDGEALKTAPCDLEWNCFMCLYVALQRMKMQPHFSWSWVLQQVTQTIDIWNRSAVPSKLGGLRYTFKEQQTRECAYDEGQQAIEQELKRASRTKAERFETQERIVAAFARFSTTALGLEKDATSLLTDGFLPAGTEFARRARRFDPNLNRSDIIQACRSAWTACGLQPLLGDPMEITPSILGYSLLYPYSDNYLDRGDVSAEDKLRFSERFRERLRGLRLPAMDHREDALWSLVGLIEEQYPRSRYPQVFDCLLAIHQAQEESIAQLGAFGHPPDAEVLRITGAKGGASVLADACLAHGWLSEEESRFSFEWGVLLQLGDDLQDVREDLLRGSETVFSRAAASGSTLDPLVIQLLNFSERVAAGMDNLPNASTTLKDLLRMSWRSLIVGAIADSHELFSPGFLVEVEHLSPFRFDFLRKRRKRLTSRQGLFVTLFDTFLEAPEHEDVQVPLPASRKHSCLLSEAGSAAALATIG